MEAPATDGTVRFHSGLAFNLNRQPRKCSMAETTRERQSRKWAFLTDSDYRETVAHQSVVAYRWQQKIAQFLKEDADASRSCDLKDNLVFNSSSTVRRASPWETIQRKQTHSTNDQASERREKEVHTMWGGKHLSKVGLLFAFFWRECQLGP